jgi:hypothetical protein
MMRQGLVCVAVPLVLALGACTQWSKPGATPDALAADQSACDTASRGQYPPDLGPGLDAAAAASQPGVACVPNRGCFTTGGSGLPPGGALADRNADARASAFDQCMMQRGSRK